MKGRVYKGHHYEGEVMCVEKLVPLMNKRPCIGGDL